jgi:hypothetical protein
MLLGQTVSQRIVIDASAEEVWKTIVSFEYNFSDNITRAKWKGDYKIIGTPGEYNFKFIGTPGEYGRNKNAEVAIKAYEEGKHIAWGVYKLGGLLVTERRDFHVEVINENSCAFTHDLYIYGLISLLIPIGEVMKGVPGFNEDLKKFSEDSKPIYSR